MKRRRAVGPAPARTGRPGLGLFTGCTGVLLAACAHAQSVPVAPAPPAAPAAAEAAAQREMNRVLQRVGTEPQLCAEGGQRTLAAEVAAAPVDLAQVLQTLLCANAGVRQSLASVAQARVAQDGAAAQWQPVLGLSAEVLKPRSAPSVNSAGLRLDAVLLDFGQARAGLNAARLALAATLSEQQDAVLAALSTGVERYAAAEVAYGRFEVAATNLRTAQDSARVAEARHAAGAAPLTDKLQALTALAQARVDRSRAANQWLAARGALAVALGLPASQALLVRPAAETAATEDSIDLPALTAEAQRNHPRLAAARARVQSLNASEAAARAQRWGSVSLGAEAGLVRSSDQDVALGGTSKTGNLSIRWTLPLLDRQLINTRVRDLQAQAQSRQAAAEEAAAQVELAVWQQFQELRSEQAALVESQAVLGHAEAALRVATERYRAGVGTFADVLSAQASASAASLQVVEVRSGLQRARWRLAAAVGRLGDRAVAL